MARNLIRKWLGILIVCAPFGCGQADAPDQQFFPPVPPNPPTADGGWERPEHPDKEALGNYSYCENWREELPSNKKTWDAPWSDEIADPVIREGVETYFAAQQPIDGKYYTVCVVSEMFANIVEYSAAIRSGYFGIAPEFQSDREDLILLLSDLFEEPSVLRLLTDIILQRYPAFESEYLETYGRDYVMNEENFLRFTAIESLLSTIPDQEDITPWVDSLYAAVTFEPYQQQGTRHVALSAVWSLARLGVSESEFREQVADQISNSQINWYVENTWKD